MSYHADTDDYLSRLATAGGTISQYNTDLLDTKIRYAYAYGLRGSTDYLKYWLCLNLTESFTGCLVPVFDDGVGNATNFNFVSGDWSSTLGLTGNGTSKYLNSNYSLATSLGTFSTGGRSDFHFGVWQTAYTNIPIYAIPMGVGRIDYNSQFAYSLFNGASGDDFNYFQIGRDVIAEVKSVSAAGTGFTLGNSPSLGSNRILRNGTLDNSSSGSPTTVYNPTPNIYLFARLNYENGLSSNWCAASISNFTMGYGLTTAQETALYNMLNISAPYYASPLMLSACF